MIATDDVLAAHRPSPNVMVHRPDADGSLHSACPAVNSDGEFMHFAAGYARDMHAIWCVTCFPKGWWS